MYFMSSDVYTSASGRVMTPVPNLAPTKSGSLFAAHKTLSLWLADEAERELIADRAQRGSRAPACWNTRLHDCDGYVADAIAKMRATRSAGGKKATHPFRGGVLRHVLLWVIWDEFDGPGAKHLLHRKNQ